MNQAVQPSPVQGQAGNINPQQEQARRRFGKIPTKPVPFPGQMNGNMQAMQAGRRPPNPGEQVNTQAQVPPGQVVAPPSVPGQQAPVQSPMPQAQPMAMPQAGGGNPQMASPGGFGQLSPQAQQAALQRQLQQQQMAGR